MTLDVSPQPAMHDALPTLLASISTEMRAVEDMMMHRDVTTLEPLQEVYREILTRGGKRLRPALALLCASLIRSPHQSLPFAVIALSSAVEMLHTSTLVHDDVIDNSLLRRGAPTLNSTWSAGDTVLAGNYMFAQAAHYSALTGNKDTIRICSDVLSYLVRGEIEQMKSQHDFEVTRAAYFRRIALKTSSIFRLATECAGLIQEFSAARVRQLKRFGVHFGIAFQVVDDILDYTSDPAALGKPAGSDLLNGTCTLPFFLYLDQQPDPSAVKSELQEANSWRLHSPAIWQDAVQRFVADVCQSDAIAQAYSIAQAHVVQAQQCLRIFPESQYRHALFGLSDLVIRRPA